MLGLQVRRLHRRRRPAPVSIAEGGGQRGQRNDRPVCFLARQPGMLEAAARREFEVAMAEESAAAAPEPEGEGTSSA